MKKCSKCGEIKPFEEFNINRHLKSGYRSDCKKCRSVYDKKRNIDPEIRRERHLRKFYNITPDQYDLLAKDGCNVCHAMANLVVDHDHSCCPGWKSCGACVRGVLCGACNKAEGLLGSDPERIRALANYVETARLTAKTESDRV